MNILEIKGLRKDFYLHHAQREIHSCENINFALEQGQFIGIVGRSGAGKSTILKCIHRTYLPTEGTSFTIAWHTARSAWRTPLNGKFSTCAAMRSATFPSSSA